MSGFHIGLIYGRDVMAVGLVVFVLVGVALSVALQFPEGGERPTVARRRAPEPDVEPFLPPEVDEPAAPAAPVEEAVHPIRAEVHAFWAELDARRRATPTLADPWAPIADHKPEWNISTRGLPVWLPPAPPIDLTALTAPDDIADTAGDPLIASFVDDRHGHPLLYVLKSPTELMHVYAGSRS